MANEMENRFVASVSFERPNQSAEAILFWLKIQKFESIEIKSVYLW